MTTRSHASDHAHVSRSAVVSILGSIGYVLFVFVMVFVLLLVLLIAFFIAMLAAATGSENPDAFAEPAIVGWIGVLSLAVQTAIMGVPTLVLAWLSFDRNWVPRSLVGFSMPTARQLLAGAGAVAVLVPLAFGLEYLFTLLGVTASEHSIMDFELAAVHYFALVPVAIFLIGPVEELWFRGLIQNYVRPGLGAAGAVVWTSVLFAIIHVPNYLLLGAEAALASVVIVFVLSLGMGALYERQRNIYVVMLVHGFYDAVLFTIEGIRLLGVF